MERSSEDRARRQLRNRPHQKLNQTETLSWTATFRIVAKVMFFKLYTLWNFVISAWIDWDSVLNHALCLPGILICSSFISSETLKWRHGTILSRQLIPLKAWGAEDSSLVPNTHVGLWLLLVTPAPEDSMTLSCLYRRVTHVYTTPYWHTCIQTYHLKYVFKIKFSTSYIP